MQKYQWGTHFFFCEVIVWDIFFKSIFCKSASRTLRSLRSLRATAGRRPAVARSERSERSVREALLQKIDLKNMSHTMTSQKKKCVPHWYFCIPIQGLHRKKNMSLKKYWSFWSPIYGLHRKKNMSPKIKSEMWPNLWKFSKKFHISTVSDAKLGTWNICIYG